MRCFMDVGTLVQIVLAAANIVLAVATLAIAFFTIKLAEATKRAAEASELNYRLMNFFEIYKMLLQKKADNVLRKTLVLMGCELITSLQNFYSKTPDRLNGHVIAIQNLLQSESESLPSDILRRYKL